MAGKRLNKNLIVSLTLFTLVMIVVVSVLMLRQLKQRDPKHFLELAQQYEREGDWQSAVIFYNKAWQRSNDAKYLVSIGDVFLGAGEVGFALNSWRQALINQPNLTEAHIRRLELRLELARLYDRNADWKLLQEGAQTFLEIETEKTAGQEALGRNAHGLALLRMARQGEEDARHGEADLRAATELAPDVVDYWLDLANHSIRQDRLDEGEGLFIELIERHASAGADAAKVRLAYAEHVASRGRYDEAERYFEESLEMAGNNPDSLRDARLGFALFLSQR